MHRPPSASSTMNGPAAVSGGKAPDLRASALVLSPEAFAEVVQGGQREMLGMPRFPDFTADDLEGLRHYIRSNVRVPVM